MKTASNVLFVGLLWTATLFNMGCPSSTVLVPNLVGLTQAAAERALAGAGLVAGTVTEANSDFIPLGDIISQDPASEVEVLADSAVAFVISKGPPVIENDAVPAALEKLSDPIVPADEAADELFSAFNANIGSVGFDVARAALHAALALYVANGGDLDVLRARSLDIPAAVFDPASVAKRQAIRAYVKSHGLAHLEAAARALNTDAPLPDEQSSDSSLKSASGDANRVLFVNGISIDFEGFLEDLGALVNGIGAIPSKYQASCTGFWNPDSTIPFQLASCTVQNIEDWISGYSNVPGSDPVTLALQDAIQGYLDSGHKVIVVPHSQGNFFTQSAIASIDMALRSSVSVIGAGSPATNMPGGVRFYSRVDIDGDLVAALSGVNVSPYPYEGIWGWGYFLHTLLGAGFGGDPQLIPLLNHHSFTGAYVQGQAGAAIVQRVKDYCVLPPEITSFSINNGAPTAFTGNVTLNNSCKDSVTHQELPIQYMASESDTFVGALWQPYSTAPSFTLSSGLGTKNVYFKVKNAAGVSPVVSDTISYVPEGLDPELPEGLDPELVGTWRVDNGGVSLDWDTDYVFDAAGGLHINKVKDGSVLDSYYYEYFANVSANPKELDITFEPGVTVHYIYESSENTLRLAFNSSNIRPTDFYSAEVSGLLARIP